MKRLNANLFIMMICFMIFTLLIFLKKNIPAPVLLPAVGLCAGSWLTANINYIFLSNEDEEDE